VELESEEDPAEDDEELAVALHPLGLGAPRPAPFPPAAAEVWPRVDSQARQADTLLPLRGSRMQQVACFGCRRGPACPPPPGGH
jgi:hypothetical protein